MIEPMMARRFNPDCSDRTLLHTAARTIQADAEDLRRSHTLRGRWVLMDDIDRAAKVLYDDHMLLVRELRARARDGE